MEIALWQFTVLSLVSAAGIAAGVIQSWISPEEMRPGKKYLEWFALLAAGCMPLLFAVFRDAVGVAVALIALLAAYLKRRYLDYLLMGALLGLAVQNLSLLYLVSVLVFLYGLPKGSLMHKDKKKLIVASACMLITVLSAVLVSLV